jgi:LysM repeat protein
MKISTRLILALSLSLLCVLVIAGPVGNASASTVAPAPTPAPLPAILGTHIVKPGESLYCIGRAYSVSPWAIATYPTNHIAWPYTIYPSQTLQIPDVRWYNIPTGPVCVAQFDAGPVPTPSPTTVPPTPGPVPTPVPGTCAQPYVIKPGDTLWWISFKFGVDVGSLASLNHIANINLIYAWTTICIK